MHDSRAVANEILKIAWEERIALTPMQIIKLVFFAHGWSLGLRGKPLVSHEVRAWQYGPVIREVYWAFNKFGRAPISELATDEFGASAVEPFDESERKLLRGIVRGYGHLHAFQLSDMTHEPGTPWTESYQPGQRARIDNRLIYKYFRGLAQQSR